MDDTVRSLLRQAAVLRDAGRLLEAVDAYRNALARDPDLPNSWYNLAALERRTGQPEAALASYQEALRRGVEGPEEVRLNRAVILAEDLARAGEAEQELRAALDASPAYVPALLNLGNLHEDCGDRRGAAAAYGEALAAEPRNALALARLAGVAELEGPSDPLLERVRERMDGAPPAERADLGFALGAALDRAGAYDAAFEAYAAANRASRESSGAGYDRRAQERFVDRSIACFDAPAPAGHTAEGAPVFICGMFRSGSTLVEQILARHPRVTAGGELGLVPLLASRFRPYPEAAAGADEAAVEEGRRAYRSAVAAAHPDAELLTDKRPDNFLHIGLIKRLFPDARIVHTVRHPADNILSLWFLHLDPAMAYALDLDDAAHWHAQYRRLMGHWQSLYGGDIHSVDYDALVREPRAAVGALLEFLALDWDEACLSFHEAGNAVRTASALQVREPLYTRSSGRWRNYRRHLGPLLEALGLS